MVVHVSSTVVADVLEEHARRPARIPTGFEPDAKTTSADHDMLSERIVPQTRAQYRRAAKCGDCRADVELSAGDMHLNYWSRCEGRSIWRLKQDERLTKPDNVGAAAPKRRCDRGPHCVCHPLIIPSGYTTDQAWVAGPPLHRHATRSIASSRRQLELDRISIAIVAGWKV